jgi:hypothetical protein
VHNYSLFGLNIESAIRLPELLPATERCVADVVVKTGLVPDSLDGAHSDGVLYQISDRRFRLAVDGVARYMVSDGREIVVQPETDSDDQSMRLFLLGSALGALLHQRGMLPLHGSCIETPKGAVVFVGKSGSGKSTTAAAFLKRGYRVLSDDITVISAGEGGIPSVTPGYPQIKLWAQSLKKLEESVDNLERIRPAIEKYAVPIAEGFGCAEVPLHAIYALNTHNTDEFSIRPATGMKKVTILKNHTYRPRYMEGIPDSKSKIVMLAQKVAISRVRRPNHGFMLEELVDLLEQDFNK